MVELHLGVNYNGQAQNLIYLPGTIINFYGTYIPGKTINIYLDGVVRTHIVTVPVDNTGYFSINAPLPTVSVGQTYAIRACTAGSLGIYECALFPDQSVETINLTVSGTGTGTTQPFGCPRGVYYDASVYETIIGGCDEGYVLTNVGGLVSDIKCVCQSAPESEKPKSKETDWGAIALIVSGAIVAAVLLPKLVGGKK